MKTLSEHEAELGIDGKTVSLRWHRLKYAAYTMPVSKLIVAVCRGKL